MSRSEVVELLRSAKVYIDFGSHPGKDRIPREAASLGCCVITNLTGNASNFDDIPIKAEYKIDAKMANLYKIRKQILNCFENYDNLVCDFSYYRSIIMAEKSKFIFDLRKFLYEIDKIIET